MMLKCLQEINPRQVTYLQKYKNKYLELDYKEHEDLIKINWEDLRFQGDPNDRYAS